MDESAPDSQQLCVSCGICCGDALFDHSRITEAEALRLRDLGFPVRRKGKQLIFAHPCPNICDKVCQVYQDRPQTCRDFRCRTLQKLERGEIDRPEADRRISAALAALADLRRRMRPGETVRQFHARFRQSEQPPDAKLAVLVFDQVMAKYF